MPFTGTCPQSWVEALAPHLSKDNNGGRVLAEQLMRDEFTHDAIFALFENAELVGDAARRVPVSVITGKRVTAEDVEAA